jgi:hypothetical protein
MGMQNGITTLEDSLAVSSKLNIFLPYNQAIIPLGVFSNEHKTK